jgi:Fic family protein
MFTIIGQYFMFKPNYTLTPELLTNITHIERLYGQIEALRLPQKLELNLKQQHMIQSAYASNKIEGNPLSLHEVTNLLLDDRVPVNRDEKEVALYFELLTQLDRYSQMDLNVNLITDLHRKLFAGIHEYAGQIRDEMVAVGKYMGQEGEVKFRIKHMPPYHAKAEIVEALTQLMMWSKTDTATPAMLKAGLFHHQFLYIHPFEDGNGRVCRTMTALLLIRLGYKINKYFILDDYYDLDRGDYSDKLHSADEGEQTEWLMYFTDGVKYSLQSALVKAKEAVRRLSMAERPSPKEKRVLDLLSEQPEMTSTEIAAILNVSRQQAHNLLSALVAKGLVDRFGTTKSSYYRLK